MHKRKYWEKEMDNICHSSINSCCNYNIVLYAQIGRFFV